MSTQQSQHLQKPTPKNDIRSLLQSDAVRTQIARVLPKHLTADRMMRVALTAILKTPKLADCNKQSLLQALMLCSQMGLEPDGRHAHLIPYGDQVQVIWDYKGLCVLAERNGVESIYADKVAEADEFNAWVDDGVKKLNHKIDFRKPRGVAYAYYASCRRNGRLDYEVMTRDEIDAIRKRSRAAQAGPWVTDYDEMAKKTVLRRMSKRWDLTSEIADAINEDDDTPSDINKPKRPVFEEDPFAALPAPQPEQLPAPSEKPAEKETPKSKEPAKPKEGKGAVNQPAQPAPEKQQSEDGDLAPKETPQQAARTAEAPKPQPQQHAEQPQPTQDTDTPPEVLQLALQVSGFKRPEGADDMTAFNALIALFRELLSKSGVTEDQFMSWARKNQVTPAGIKVTDLAASKFAKVAKIWATVLPEIKKC